MRVTINLSDCQCMYVKGPNEVEGVVVFHGDTIVNFVPIPDQAAYDAYLETYKAAGETCGTRTISVTRDQWKEFAANARELVFE